MTYDLRTERWIPWERLDRTIEWGPPSALVADIARNPVVAIAAPRPDFSGALQEFLIGLLTVAMHPRDDDDWTHGWSSPPSPEDLHAALGELPPAFDLEGDGPRFFQDYSAVDLASVDPSPVEQLLIDAPGDKPRRCNTDLFVKRDRFESLGRPAAAMALLTLQTYAPEGGRGHRTSLRGGGPLTTLLDPRADTRQPLWEKLWMNVETGEQWLARTPMRTGDMDRIFPWLSPTRVSDPEHGSPTTPADGHPLQAYFGLPRRIRLEFGDQGSCDLTGIPDERTVTHFRMRNYGVRYVGWRHPLSAYRRKDVESDWLPVHAQPGGIGWRDWAGLTTDSPEGGVREPARTVSGFYRRARHVDGGARSQERRIHAFGYDMDNMKARGWVDASLPVFTSASLAERRELADFARQCVDAAGIVGTALASAVRAALFQNPAEAQGDFSQIKMDLWAATESDFFQLLRRRMAGDTTESIALLCRQFATVLESRSLRVFDRWCPSDGLTPAAMRRLVVARLGLVRACQGHPGLGAKLFSALRLPLPTSGAQRNETPKRSAHLAHGGTMTSPTDAETVPPSPTPANPGNRARQWWRDYCDPKDGNPGTRARLRRCHSPLEATTIPAAVDLVRRLGATSNSFGRVADIDTALNLARVLAHVERDDARQRPMQAAGWPRFPGAKRDGETPAGGKPRLAEVRFRRLLDTGRGEEQVTAFVRLLALLGNTVNITALANDFWYWGDRTKRRWAFDYYNAGIAAPQDTNLSPEDEA